MTVLRVNSSARRQGVDLESVESCIHGRKDVSKTQNGTKREKKKVKKNMLKKITLLHASVAALLY